jgi:cyclic dehypoxanthinyl futalosine synthase
MMDLRKSIPLKKIREKVFWGERVGEEEALALFEVDLLTLGEWAHLKRTQLHPERLVTYVVDRNINYTNICISRCQFCAFYRDGSSPEGYVLDRKRLGQKIEETLRLGGTQILLQGGLHPDLTLDFYEEMLRFIKRDHPIHIHGFSPPEIIHMSRMSGLSILEVLRRLISAGLDSIPGGGAEILVDRVRSLISPQKCGSEKWLEVMETAHGLGLKTTATMMFGHVESLADRVSHLLKIRTLQDRTGGFTAFIPWPFQPRHTRLGGKEVTAVDYLRTLAISRIVLDNVKNIQASWVTQGPKMAQVSLNFGANDMGSTMIEENVVAATGVSFRLSKEEIIRLVRDAGFEAAQRDMEYRWLT